MASPSNNSRYPMKISFNAVIMSYFPNRRGRARKRRLFISFETGRWKYAVLSTYMPPFQPQMFLPLVAQKRTGVSVLVVKNSRSRLLHNVDVTQFNAQYANSLTVKVSDKFHDRFLIIDKTTLIHVGASLNHLGKKCFAFSSLDKSNIPDILAKL